MRSTAILRPTSHCAWPSRRSASRASSPRRSWPLPANTLVRRAEVAGAGFINFYLTSDAGADTLTRVHTLGDLAGYIDELLASKGEAPA